MTLAVLLQLIFITTVIALVWGIVIFLFIAGYRVIKED